MIYTASTAEAFGEACLLCKRIKKVLFYLFLRCISGMNVAEGRWSTTQQGDSLRESSGVKRSPEFMSSVVVSTSNSSASKKGTGRLLGLVSQQVELGQ